MEHGSGEIFSFCIGLTISSLSVMLYGGVDVLKHYILRLILFLTGQTPLNYAQFLDHACRLNFLKKVGGGYIFIHRLLLEHFGAMEAKFSYKGATMERQSKINSGLDRTMVTIRK